MDDEKLARLGPVLTKVGQEVMRIVEGEPNNVYLYVEIGDNWVGPSLYKDEGDKLRYIDLPDIDLEMALMDAWDLEPVDKRWTGMEYMIEHGKFNATFQFDDLKSYDGRDDRRQQFLHRRFGDKPQIYPPLNGGWELKPPV